MDKKAAAVTIAEQIRRDILRGVFRPGESLRIRPLAERFGTSDLPVREALWVLQKDGLVENKPYSGAFVRVLSAAEIAETYEIRSALERLALTTTPAAVAVELLDELREVMKSLEHAARDEDALAYGDLNREFHQKLVSASTNRSLLDLLDRLWSGQSAYRIVFSTNHDRIARSLAEHELIFEAFSRGDMEATAQLLKQHRDNGVVAAIGSMVEQSEPKSGDGAV